ncbi:MAG TPA: hypothetical protein VGX21_09565 [Methylomirabilota bacterium]|nr:hypothetical protein [Methylomirabilota bacterium]
MRHDRWALAPDELTLLGKIVTRFPGLASAVHAQVTRLIQTMRSEGRLARETELDEFLGKVVDEVVARTRQHRRKPPAELDEATDSMVLLLARNSVARARPRLLEDLRRPNAK